MEMQPWLPTPPQQAALEANGPDPHGLPGIAIILNAIPLFDIVQFINTPAVRALGQSSVGAVGNAHGLAKLYAAAISEVDGKAPLLGLETLAEFSRLHTRGLDLVSGLKDHFALGFEAKHGQYPFLGEDAFGHSGWAGSEAFADPKSGLTYGYTRRRFPAFFAAPENARLAAAARRAAEALR